MLGRGEDSPTSFTPGWAQGARKFDLMSGYVMCAERAAGFGRTGRWEPLLGPWPGGVQPEEHARLPGTVFAAVPETRRVRGRPVVGVRGRLARLLDPGHPQMSSVHGP